MSENPLRRLYRRRFGRHTIDDPRPIAAAAPYTYFLPSDGELAALRAGDMVKLVVRSVPRSLKWDAERMWVSIAACAGEACEGRLENEPYDMPQLRPGTLLRFRRSDVVDVIWSEDRATPPPTRPPRREYWSRCMADACVLRGDSPVDYLYREEPDMTGEGDRDPDSGWRLHGTPAASAADERAGRTPDYVALGVVLNRDDRWLALIDAPVGSRFRRAPSGEFEPWARTGP